MKEQFNQSQKKNTQFEFQRVNLQEKYNQLLESKALLKEDLNARLLQRAELVAQKEEFEQIIEQFTNKNRDFYELASFQFFTHQKLASISINVRNIKNQMEEKYASKELKENQIQQFNSISSLEAALQQANQQIKIIKAKLINLQKNNNLPHPDTLYYEFNQKKNQCLADFIEFQRKQMTSSLQGSIENNLKEFLILLEQYITIKLLQQEQCQQIEELKQVFRSKFDIKSVQNDSTKINNELEQLKKESEEQEQLTFQILKEKQRQAISNSQQLVISFEEQFQVYVKKKANEAYENYLQENEEKLIIISQQYNQNQLQQLVKQIQNQFFELISNQTKNELKNLTYFIEQLNYSEKIIKINISFVDDEVLPKLRDLLTQLAKLKQELEKLNQNQQPYKNQMQNIQNDIQILENEFKVKITTLSKKEVKLQSKLKETKSLIDQYNLQIKNQRQQLLQTQKEEKNNQMQTQGLEEFLNQLNNTNYKCKLEQEIIDLNNTITTYQQQKKRIEMTLSNSIQSPEREFRFIERKNSNSKEKDKYCVSSSFNDLPLNRYGCKQIESSIQNSADQKFRKVTPLKEFDNKCYSRQFSENRQQIKSIPFQENYIRKDLPSSSPQSSSKIFKWTINQKY